MPMNLPLCVKAHDEKPEGIVTGAATPVKVRMNGKERQPQETRFEPGAEIKLLFCKGLLALQITPACSHQQVENLFKPFCTRSSAVLRASSLAR